MHKLNLSLACAPGERPLEIDGSAIVALPVMLLNVACRPHLGRTCDGGHLDLDSDIS